MRELQAFLTKQRPDAEVVVRDPRTDSGAECDIVSIEIEEPLLSDDGAKVILVVE